MFNTVAGESKGIYGRPKWEKRSLKFNGMETNISLNLIEFYQWRASNTHTHGRGFSSLPVVVSPWVAVTRLNLANTYLYKRQLEDGFFWSLFWMVLSK